MYPKDNDDILVCDRYIIIRYLSAGRYGKVYKVYDIVDNKYYALKKYILDCINVIHPSILRETSILNKMDHPHIAKIKNIFYGSNYDSLNIITELCEDRLTSDRLNCKRRFLTVLSGVHYIHKLGFIHGDLSPSNILIKNTVTKIVDFGNCRRNYRKLKNEIRPTMTIMPFEFINNKVNIEFIDSWALGSIYYYIAANELLIDSTNDTDYLKNIIENFSITSENKHRKFNKLYSVLASSDVKLLKRMFQFNPKKRIVVQQIFDEYKDDMINCNIKFSEPNIFNSKINIAPNRLSFDDRIKILNIISETVFSNKMSIEIIHNVMINLNRLTVIKNLVVDAIILFWIASKIIEETYLPISAIQELISHHNITTSTDMIRIRYYEMYENLNYDIDPDTIYSVINMIPDNRDYFDLFGYMMLYTDETALISEFEKVVILYYLLKNHRNVRMDGIKHLIDIRIVESANNKYFKLILDNYYNAAKEIDSIIKYPTEKYSFVRKQLIHVLNKLGCGYIIDECHKLNFQVHIDDYVSLIHKN